MKNASSLIEPGQLTTWLEFRQRRFRNNLVTFWKTRNTANDLYASLAFQGVPSHRRCKKVIYQTLLRQPGVANVALEKPLDNVRPDVSTVIHGVPAAVEVQISSLTP